MSRESSTRAVSIHSNGYLTYSTITTSSLSARPVFYLTNDVQLISGTGTSTDPFIIE